MLRHQVDEHAGDGDVESHGERPAGQAPVLRELCPKRPIEQVRARGGTVAASTVWEVRMVKYTPGDLVKTA